jgi:hypothetical protein
MVNCFSLKRLTFSKWNNCIFVFHVIMLFYISSWPNFNTLCTVVDLERFYIFRVDQWVQKSGSPMLHRLDHVRKVWLAYANWGNEPGKLSLLSQDARTLNEKLTSAFRLHMRLTLLTWLFLYQLDFSCKWICWNYNK